MVFGRRAFLRAMSCMFLVAMSLALSAAESINNGMDLKILPLGASITLGVDSTDGNGYRLDLRSLLEANGSGNNVTYVGTVHNGTMTNNACEAYSGWTIQEVDDKALKTGAYDYKPNIVLIHLGTNDCIQHNGDGAPDRFATLLSHVKSALPDTLVVVSSLVHNRIDYVEQCIRTLNGGLRRVAHEASTGTNAQRIHFVDMFDAVPVSDINEKDSTHPTDAGYAIMARVWYEGLRNASSLISAPDPTGKAPPSDDKPTLSGAIHVTIPACATFIIAAMIAFVAFQAF